jgi:SAM-dependent methyltransferase
MTRTSLIALNNFLVDHQHLFKDDNMRIADYGGTDEIGKDIVKNMLAEGNLKNYHMLDFDNGVDLREPIAGEKFDLGICMDLLEHTSNPFIVAKNIVDSLNQGAFLFVTAPFVWELHGYPNDYWRFCPQGLEELFKEMEVEIVYAEEDTYTPPVPNPLPPVPPVTLPWTRVIGIFKKK